MKLRFIVDYTTDNTDCNMNYVDDSNYNQANPSANIQNSKNSHESYSFRGIINSTLRGICRDSYTEYELPLIDIPDELVFQFMMMGLQDYDFICYNVRNKKIAIGNLYYDTQNYCADDNFGKNSVSSTGHYPKSVGSCGANNNKDIMFNFELNNDPKVKRDELIINIDSTTGYEEFMKVLTPHINHRYQKDYLNLASYLRHYGMQIGIATQNYSNYPKPMGDAEEESSNGYYTKIIYKDKCQLTNHDMYFIFSSYLDDHELYLENKSAIETNEYYTETMRVYCVDLLTKLHECTETKWDMQ